MKKLFMAILGVIASGISFLLGILGFTAVTSQMILVFLFRYAREIAVFVILHALWAMIGFPLLVLNPIVGIFLFARNICGPKEGENRPQRPKIFCGFAALGCFLPPWGLYMGASGAFWWNVAALTAVGLFAPQSLTAAWGAAFIGSLWAVLMSSEFRKPVRLISCVAMMVALGIFNPQALIDVLGVVWGMIWGLISGVFGLLIWTIKQILLGLLGLAILAVIPAAIWWRNRNK